MDANDRANPCKGVDNYYRRYARERNNSRLARGKLAVDRLRYYIVTQLDVCMINR